MSDNLAEDIAQKALRISWWDTETAARRVAEYAADRIEELTELCALEYQRAWLLDTQKNIAEEKLAQQDDLVQAAVAAALREVVDIAMRYHADALKWAKKVRGLEDHIGETDTFKVAQDILDLITPDAQAALDRVVAAEWRDAIALMTGIVDDCLLVDAQGKIIDFEYTDFQMRIAAIREGGE